MPSITERSSIKSNTLATMAKNAVANLLRHGTGWMIILLLPPILVRTLDRPTYAVWLLLLQISAYITVFDGGIQMAVARYVARAEALRDRDSLARLLSSCGMLMVLASAAAVLLTFIAAWKLTDLFRQIPAAIAPSARSALLVLGVALAFALPCSVLAGFFNGTQRYGVPAFSTSTGKLAGAMGAAWAAYHHQGLAVMAVWVAAGTLLQCFIYIVFWKRERKPDLLQYSHVERAITREFLVFCAAMFASQFSSILITGMDMPVVAAFDFHSAAYYGVAITLSNLLIVPHGAIVSTLLPVAAGISAAEHPPRLGQLLVKTTAFATVLLCLLALPLMVLLPVFLRVWVGAEYASHSMIVAEILILAQFVRLAMLPYAMIGFAAGQQQRMLLSPVAEGVINLTISLVAVQVIGALGVALGTLVGALAGVWLHFTVSLRRTDCIVVSRTQLWWSGIARPVACTVPVLLMTMLAARQLPSVPLQIAVAIAAEASLFSLFWHLTFDEAEREQLRAMLRHFAASSQKWLSGGIVSPALGPTRTQKEGK